MAQQSLTQQIQKQIEALQSARRLRELMAYLDKLEQEGRQAAIPVGTRQRAQQELVQLESAIEYGQRMIKDLSRNRTTCHFVRKEGHFAHARRQVDGLTRIVVDDPAIMELEAALRRAVNNSARRRNR